MNYRITLLSLLCDMFPFLPLVVFIFLFGLAFPGRLSLDSFFLEVNP